MRTNDTSGLLIFDTHLIQYRSPVFRELHKILPNTRVVFFSKEYDGNQWWFAEVNKSQNVDWGLPLHQGFANQTLKSKGRWGRFLEINRLLSEQKPGAVLLYGYYLLEHWSVLLLSRARGIPVLFIGETYAPNGPTSAVRGWLRKSFLGGVSRFISIGLRNHDFYSHFGISDEKIDDAKYCIDNNFFKSDGVEHEGKREEIRKRLNIGNDELVLLFAGRLFGRKRPLDLIRLHQALEKTKVHTIVLGSGELEKDLKEQSRSLARFHMMGFKSQKEIRDFYFASDILIVPSEFETWGLVVNEAFACGMTAAVSETCGTAGDLVVENQTGMVFPVGKIEDIVPTITKLAANANALKDLKSNAHRKVMEEFTPARFAKAIKTAFEKVTGRHVADEAVKTAATGT